MNAKLEHVMKDYIYFKKYNPEIIESLEFYVSRIYYSLMQKVNYDYCKLSKSDLNGIVLYYENIMIPHNQKRFDNAIDAGYTTITIEEDLNRLNNELNYIKEILKKMNER